MTSTAQLRRDLKSSGRRAAREAARRKRKPGVEPERRFDQAPACYQALIAAALLAGLRESELLALTWGQIDLEGKQLRVVAAYRKGTTADPKSATSRHSVPMPKALVLVLRAWKVASPHKVDDALVFCTASAQHENHSNILKRALRPALRTLASPGPSACTICGTPMPRA